MKKITMRFSEELHEQMLIQASENNMTLNEYFRNLILLNLSSDIKETIELKKSINSLFKNMGNNINQIARKINSESSKKQLDEIEEMIKELWEYSKQ